MKVLVLALFVLGITGCCMDALEISTPTTTPDIPKTKVLRLTVDTIVPFIWDNKSYNVILTKVGETDGVAVASFTLHYYPPMPDGVINTFWLTLIRIQEGESVMPTEWQAWNKADQYSTAPAPSPVITVTHIFGETTPKLSGDDGCEITISQ